ncbi:hypothetical protein SteCoe_833 [Stentor coeruleus]|uniref:Cation efflux protein cytoplasmic domain-containing protein n=1 Tax=Stentor coeruleus TaxID=5963 RepID=A0A1R2D3B0_9CILI|nr:hypothetical protein SteCoe_833 [Stentor coeruleus]
MESINGEESSSISDIQSAPESVSPILPKTPEPLNISKKVSESFILHQKNSKKYLSRLYCNLAFSVVFMFCEIAGGIISGSIAILTDAFHVLTDVLGFLITIASLHFTRRSPTWRMSYGYYRAEVMGALLSIALIWGLTIWLVYEAIARLIKPQYVDGLIMLITACGGLAGNVLMGIILIKTNPDEIKNVDGLIMLITACGGLAGNVLMGIILIKTNPDEIKNENESLLDKSTDTSDGTKHKRSLNMRAAFIHVIGDSIQSIGVIIAGVVVYVKPEYKEADPVCTLLFCVVVLGTTIPILKDCIKILMEASPDDTSLEQVIRTLKTIEEVIDLHDFHLWSLSAGKLSFTCHFVTNDPATALEKANKILKEDFNIGHITIQTEISGTNYYVKMIFININFFSIMV